MTRSTKQTISELTESATETAGQIAGTVGETASAYAAIAADKVGTLFNQIDDGFTDRLVTRAKGVKAGSLSPSRSPAAKTGVGAGLFLAGAATIAAGALALYYWRERNQEEADFDLLAKDGDFELRRYKAHLVAETVQPGSRDEALGSGFRALANYIFAKPGGRAPSEESDEKIAMTVPVSAASEDNGSWRVRFVMPEAHTRETLPQPAAGVALAKQPKRHIAAIRFAGRGSDADLVAAKRSELKAWVAERGYKSIGDPEYAYYNAPIVPGPLRRNEVWIAIEAP
ncbi:heme-binding protein [Sphingorhabdus soli]|uniref:Heme-binding protein n=1 Tax=Flavisphingopyxis soli TaxID=2601267 RepID=A0A5C6U5T0_9SPHN|nr:heme-binding protein [Sphingorhabdus soli]TXC68162.1 heme-binding protein [Sphingorhabdus soli]